MSTLNREEVLQKAREQQVKFVRLQFTDIFGLLKNIAITVEDLERALAGSVTFDSSVLDGFVRNEERDIILRPDPSTFEIFPWRPREGAVARLLCDVDNPDGTPYGSCPRQRLKAVLAEAKALGFEVRVGIEAEFFLFHTDEKGYPTTVTHDRAGYCDLTPVDLGENARRDMVLTLEEMGMEIGSSHHELSPGQHEIVLKPDAALAAADKTVTFKFVVRTIAQRHGLHASFMPRPLPVVNGSGLHFRILLERDGKSAFYSPQGFLQLSRVMHHFVGGVLAHARALTAVTNPLVNSYKRLISGDLAPVYVAWSAQNRNALLRVPAAREAGTSLEVRSPDPACNPYLALAGVLEAGLAGVQQEVEPPPLVSENVHQLEPWERQERQLQRLPRSLGEALEELKQDPVVQQALGTELYQRFLEAKEAEWRRFLEYIHPWEINEYLTSF